MILFIVSLHSLTILFITGTSRETYKATWRSARRGEEKDPEGADGCNETTEQTYKGK